MLSRNTDARIRVFVVWEPVLETDWRRPGDSITSMIPDARAVHFWDADRRLSTLYGGPASAGTLAPVSTVGFKMTNVIWDAVLVYPPGVSWGARAQRLAAPVYKYAGSLLAP
jgi:hypothetical protein